jgi:epoxide hydrolase-like predicted phosphatase
MTSCGACVTNDRRPHDRMTIKAVVVDIGGVLERVDDASWPQKWMARWERRRNKPAGHLAASIAEHAPADVVATGGITEAEVRDLYAAALGLDVAEVDEMWAEMWDAYCGELDVQMRDFVAGLRPALKTAILSNSADGARREEQRRYDFESLVDGIVYSHEVGIAKPDPAVFRLTEQMLRVQPDEIVFIDDHDGHVTAARARGWYAVLHTDTQRTIAEVTQLIDAT